MPVFRNSEMRVFSAESEWSHPCEVRISDGSIAISYDHDGHPVVYEGLEVEPGHFKLRAQAVNGRASLHRFADDGVLEGFWVESGHEGMWRIQIDE